jgi:hypothetical protein
MLIINFNNKQIMPDEGIIQYQLAKDQYLPYLTK